MTLTTALLHGFANGTGKKVLNDALIAGVGVSIPFMADLGGVKTIIAIVVSLMMIVLLGLRIYNEWRRAKRQDSKDQHYKDDE